MHNIKSPSLRLVILISFILNKIYAVNYFNLPRSCICRSMLFISMLLYKKIIRDVRVLWRKHLILHIGIHIYGFVQGSYFFKALHLRHFRHNRHFRFALHHGKFDTFRFETRWMLLKICCKIQITPSSH